MTIVVYAHRPKRPPPKQKASALARAAKAATKLPTIVAPTGEKQLKRQRMERAQHPRSLGRSPSGEIPPEIEAFFARNVRPGGPLLPQSKEPSGRDHAATEAGIVADGGQVVDQARARAAFASSNMRRVYSTS
jgi:hypothetical protein